MVNDDISTAQTLFLRILECLYHQELNIKYIKTNSTGRKRNPKMFSSSKTRKVKSTQSGGKIRFKPGTVALREIRRYQKSVNNLMPRSPLIRLVRDIASEYNVKFQQRALMAIQEAAESFLTGLFEDTQLCATHANRITVM